MLSPAQIMSMMDIVFIPISCGTALMFAKLTRGETARKAEKNFFAFLVVMTLITIRTVVLCDEAWLIHTTTLATMIVGALAIPGHDAFIADTSPRRDVDQPYHYAETTMTGRQMT